MLQLVYNNATTIHPLPAHCITCSVSSFKFGVSGATIACWGALVFSRCYQLLIHTQCS